MAAIRWVGPKDPLFPHDMVLQCTDGQVNTHRHVVGMGAKVIGGCISSTAPSHLALSTSDAADISIRVPIDETAADMEMFCGLLYPDSAQKVTMTSAELLLRLVPSLTPPESCSSAAPSLR